MFLSKCWSSGCEWCPLTQINMDNSSQVRAAQWVNDSAKRQVKVNLALKAKRCFSLSSLYVFESGILKCYMSVSLKAADTKSFFKIGYSFLLNISIHTLKKHTYLPSIHQQHFLMWSQHVPNWRRSRQRLAPSTRLVFWHIVQTLKYMKTGRLVNAVTPSHTRKNR